METFTLEKSLRRDGLTVTPAITTISQRMGKGDIAIPTRTITAVSGYRAAYDIPFTEGSLTIRCGSKKYVLRRLPKAQRDAAVQAIQQAMAEAT